MCCRTPPTPRPLGPGRPNSMKTAAPDVRRKGRYEMGRSCDAIRIYFYPGHPGARAMFLAEARTKKEVRQVRELFDVVGQLAEVVPISSGRVMSYAVQVQGDTSLFGKVECLMKAQFP